MGGIDFAGERGLVTDVNVAEGHTGAAYLPAVPELDPAQYELLLAREAQFKGLGNDSQRRVLELP